MAVDLKELEKRVDHLIKTETKESLLKWLKKQRKKK